MPPGPQPWSVTGWGDIGFHTDHQDTARHVLDVVHNSAGNKFTFPSSGEPWHGMEMYVWDFTGAATHYIELSDAAFDGKMKGWAAHASQYEDVGGLRDTWRAIGEQVGMRVGLPKGRQAEGFTKF